MVEELPESSFRRVLFPKSPRMAPQQLPDTNRLGRRTRARWLARLVHARLMHARAREHALLSYPAKNTRSSLTPQCACAPAVPGFGTHVCRGLFSLVPRILNPYPVLAWREKLFLAIFTCFFFFPLLSSLLCTYYHLIQYIFYLLIVYLLSLECKLYEGMDFVYFCLLLYPHGKNSAWLMLGTQLINKSKAFH